MNSIRKLTLTALLAGLATATSTIIYIPLGFAKIFPVQHFVNVLSAVVLGPWYATIQAFLTSTLRNLLGTGSLFAYPGSMIGALLAGIFYAKSKKFGFAFIGEVFGTGVLGAMATYPISILFLGKEATLFGFIPSFILSSFGGAILGYILLKVLAKNESLGGILYENGINNRRF